MNPITGKTRLLGVIGHPVSHSLSPVMHNAAIAALGLDYIYLPLPIEPSTIEDGLKGLKAIGIKGFNATIPHKQAIIPYLSEISQEAQLVGAVNTVKWTSQGWYGTNTDVEGFLAPLKPLNQSWQQITPVILGNGGAARAVVVGCWQLGCPEIHVIGRNKHKLGDFWQSWQSTPLKDAVKLHYWDNVSGVLSQTKLLINTTPVGMSPNTKETPLTWEIMEQLRSDAIVYDLIYNPSPTLFLQMAQRQGAMIIDGLEMLVQQGAKALELWLEQAVPVEIMRTALIDYLEKRK
ncbi:MAG: shikimate dehydrogenase [Microcystaceae cyanobacterium]